MAAKTKTIVAFDESEKASNHGVFGITCNENRNLVYVNNLRTPALLVMDGKTGKYLRNVDYDDGKTGFGLVSWNPVSDRLYAVATNQSKLYVFDGPTEKLLKKVKLNQGPRGIIVDPESGKVFVAHYGEGWFGGARKITCFDTDGKKLGTANVDKNPWEMCADNGTLYVSCKGMEFSRPGTLCAVDIDSMELTGRVQVGRRPRGIAVKRGKAYVAARYDSAVHIVDIKDMEVTGKIGVDCDPIDAVPHPKKDIIYVMNRQGEMRLGDPYRGEEATISVIDAKRDVNVERISTQKTNHYGVINSKTGILYVGAEDSNDVASIDIGVNRVLRTTMMGRIIDKIEMLPGTGHVYGCSHITDELVVIDGNNGTLKDAVKVGGWPWNIVADPETKRVFVNELDRGTITVYDGEKNRILKSIEIGNNGQFCDGTPIVEHHQYLFSYMAMDTKRKRLYVTCPATDSLAVLDAKRNKHIRTVDIGWQDKGSNIRLWDIAVNETTGYVYLHNPYMSQVLAVEPNSLEVTARIDVPKFDFRQISLLKADPGRNLLYLAEHIIDCKKNEVTGTLPKDVGNVVEHVDDATRRMYVSHFKLDTLAYQKVSKMTITDADTYRVLDTLRLKRPSGHNLAVDPGLGMVVSKPLIKNMPFYAEVDVHNID